MKIQFTSFDNVDDHRQVEMVGRASVGAIMAGIQEKRRKEKEASATLDMIEEAELDIGEERQLAPNDELPV